MIGIHHKPGTFSDRWIKYCEDNGVLYKIVNCYDNNIIDQLNDCDVLMWHHSHQNYKDVLFAKELFFALQQSGKQVFPNFNTNWHFDDKLGQKYLLESISAPLVSSYVFFTKNEALEWINNTTFPKVFKLRGGAGAANVMLAKNRNEAKKLIKKSFGKGFAQFNRIGNLHERIRKFKEGDDNLLGVIKGFARLLIPTEYSSKHHREKGYVYFQEFIPSNTFDIRVIVIGNKAFAIKRLVRNGDFRASGSGNIIYDKTHIDERCIKIAFDTNQALNTQCIAFDFIFNENNDPLIVEISYGFSMRVYDQCCGYWDSKMVWHPGNFNPQIWMIEDLIKSLSLKNPENFS